MHNKGRKKYTHGLINYQYVTQTPCSNSSDSTMIINDKETFVE